jgi:DNA invertase Pin-like site-specific DNA recombinase
VKRAAPAAEKPTAAEPAQTVKAVAYMRTSSAANVGGDKDSEGRQRAAITRYAERHHITIAPEDWFYDEAAKGTDPIETRAGFSALLDRIEGNGVRLVLIEDATRFARDLLTQELGIVIMINRGVRVVTSHGEDLTDISDPTRVMMRQIAGAFAQYEKARLVARLKRARDLKRERTGRKVGGRKSMAEERPEVVALAKRLRRGGLSLREISAELERRGHVTSGGKPFQAVAVARMMGASR